MVGLVTGVVRFILEFSWPTPLCGEKDTRPDMITKFHYLYFAAFLFGFTGIVTIAISLLTKPIPQNKVSDDVWIVVTYPCLYIETTIR